MALSEGRVERAKSPTYEANLSVFSGHFHQFEPEYSLCGQMKNFYARGKRDSNMYTGILQDNLGL
jgi:hypothetical protein